MDELFSALQYSFADVIYRHVIQSFIDAVNIVNFFIMEAMMDIFTGLSLAVKLRFYAGCFVKFVNMLHNCPLS